MQFPQFGDGEVGVNNGFLLNEVIVFTNVLKVLSSLGLLMSGHKQL